MKKILSKLIHPPIKIAGLDIGSSSIKIMEIEGETLETAKLVHYAIEPIPEHLITSMSEEKTVENIDALGQIVKKCWKKSGISTKNVALALPNIAIMDKKIPLHVFNEDEEDEMLLQVEQTMVSTFLPEGMSVEDIVFDYSVREKIDYDDAKHNVLMVTAKKTLIEERISIAEAAGLIPQILDVEKYTIQNLLKLMKGEDFYKKTYLTIDTSSNILKTTIFRKGDILYSRDSDFGGFKLTEDIMRELNVDYTTAEKMKIERTDSKVLELEENFINNYISEFFITFQYFTSVEENPNIDEMILFGGLANTPGFAEKFKQAILDNDEKFIKTAPYVARPLQNLEKDTNINIKKFTEDEPRLFLVSALALRQFLRKY